MYVSECSVTVYLLSSPPFALLLALLFMAICWLFCFFPSACSSVCCYRPSPILTPDQHHMLMEMYASNVRCTLNCKVASVSGSNFATLTLRGSHLGLGFRV